MSQTTTARATTDAILAAARTTTTRSGYIDADTGLLAPDPFVRPTPTTTGWDVSGSIGCDLRVVAHRDLRGRTITFFIPDFVSPVSAPDTQIALIAGTHATEIASLSGTFATAEVLAAAVAAAWNTDDTADVAEATSAAVTGGAVVELRALRTLADPDVLGTVAGGYCSFDIDDPQPGNWSTPVYVYREAPGAVSMRIYTIDDAGQAATVQDYGPSSRSSRAWALARDYGDIGVNNFDERLNIAARSQVFANLYGVDWSGDYDISGGTNVEAVVDYALVRVSPADTASVAP